MTNGDIYSTAKKSFPYNIFIALLLGVLIGYFSGVYISGVSGKATHAQVCGDDHREGLEACDGGSRYCVTRGGYPGTQNCTNIANPGNCSGFEACRAASHCDGITRDSNEQCDGMDLGGLSCEELGLPRGTLRCDATCKFNKTGCGATGLVGWWKFDEINGNTAADSSGNKNDGIVYPSGPTWTTGKYENALSFNPVTTDYVIVGNPVLLKLSTGTIGAWIKTPSGGSGYRAIVVKAGAYHMYLKDNVLIVYDPGAGVDWSTGINLADSNWHHVAFTFQSGVTDGTKIYVDGVPKLTTTTSVANQLTDLWIGGGGSGSGSERQSFGGLIDDVRIYNRVLSDGEVAAIAGNVLGLGVSASFTPLAGASFTPLAGNTAAGTRTATMFSFSATAFGGTTYTYSWDFGDGTTSTLQNPTHVYATSGTKTVTVTVASGTQTATSNPLTVVICDGSSRDCCYDSDPGNDHYVAGTLIRDSSSFSPSPDVCLAGPDVKPGYVRESYCAADGFNFAKVDYLCPNGCSSGACNAAATAPSAPTLSLVATTSNSVNLSWTASTGTVSGYNIYRATSTSPTSFSRINTVPITTVGTAVSPYKDSPVASSTTYLYKIAAFNSAGESANSTPSVSATTSAAPVAPGPTSGLVAWWKFDDGTGTVAIDSSGNGNAGTLFEGAAGAVTCYNSGGCPKWVSGKKGAYAIQFFYSAVDYVGTNLAMPTTDFTVAFWYYPTTIGTAYKRRPFGSADSQSGQNGLDYAIYTGSGAGVIMRKAGTSYDFSCGSTPAINTWDHVVITVSSSTGAKCYRNGVQQGSNPAATSMTTGSLKVKIGGSGDVQDAFTFGTAQSAFDGYIDDVRIYNGVLTQADITALAAP